MPSLEELWVVLYCEDDDSHVLVEDTAVIYDGDLDVGEEVKFAFPGHKDLLTGVVKGVSADRKAMTKLQDNLNSSTKPKRDLSFHSNEPRKAAKRCHSILQQTKPKSKSKSDSRKKSKSNHSVPSSGKHAALASGRQKDEANDTLNSSGEDALTDKNDSSSSDDDEQQLQLLVAKMAAKRRKSDLNLLKELSNTSKGDAQVETASVTNTVKVIAVPNPSAAGTPEKVSNTVKVVADPSPSTESTSVKGKRRKLSKPLQSKKRIVEIKFEGNSLKWNAGDEGVEKLWADNDAYILEKDLKKAKSSCGNSSLLTRFLTRAIFKDEAREICSVSGKPPMTPSWQDFVEVRTKLNQEGVEAIVAYVDHRGTKKNWKVPPASTIKRYMANILCEDRAEARARAEAANEDQANLMSSE